MSKNFFIDGFLNQFKINLFWQSYNADLRFISVAIILFSFVMFHNSKTVLGQSVKFKPGDLILVVDHNIATHQQVMDAYGMAVHLANAGINVGWWIARDKLYEEVDFSAETDDTPDPHTSGPDGNVQIRSYRAGPFVIKDPIASTTQYNEAWDEIERLRTLYGLNPVIHELREEPETARVNIAFLTFMPKVSYSANAGIADQEIRLAKIPGFNVPSPGSEGLPATVAGGGLFEGSKDSSCGRIPRYDVYIQDHYDYTDENPLHEKAASEYDEFLKKGTTCIFECLSATIDNRVHWLTNPGNIATEGVAVDDHYTVESDFADHPFAQTMGRIPIEGGAFMLWDADGNDFRDSAENIFFDASGGDIGYMLGQVEGGKFFFAGGHRRRNTGDMRIILNALLYEIVSPQFDHDFAPKHFASGVEERKRVKILVRGGALAQNVFITDTLADGVELVPGSVRFSLAGPTYTWDAGTKTLRFAFGDIDPETYSGRIIAIYDVLTFFQNEGEAVILSSVQQYDDPWTHGITFSGSLCESAKVKSDLKIEKSSLMPYLRTGDNNITVRITVTNSGTSILRNVVVKDMLPLGVTFGGTIENYGRGSADWGVSEADTLTWNAGWFIPGEGHSIEFEVNVSPSAPGDFLLNDGAHATATRSDNSSIEVTSIDLVLPVKEHTVNTALFSITPSVVLTRSEPVLSFTVTNTGPQVTFAESNYIELTFPDSWSKPVDVTHSAGWQWYWWNKSHSLGFMRSGNNINWGTDMSFQFSFKSRAPLLPEISKFSARATAMNRQDMILFEQDAAVVVISSTGNDSDGDGISDEDELIAGSDPDNADTDGDGIPDGVEVGADPHNPIDTDGDGTPDFFDLDSDEDGLPDSTELLQDPDEDDVYAFRDTDSDNDGLGDRDESTIGTNPYDPDTDHDGLDDMEETIRGTNPLNPDSDCDGITDGEEVVNGTDPLGIPGCGDEWHPDGLEIFEWSEREDATIDLDSSIDGWIDLFDLNTESKLHITGGGGCSCSVPS